MSSPILSREELIAKMEEGAAVLLRNYGPIEARRQMELLFAQTDAMAKYHKDFPHAVLAMGAKLDELIENP